MPAQHVEAVAPLGEVLLELSLRIPEWVHRRVETVQLIDASSVRRHVSVDFDLSELEALPAVPTVVPVAYLLKEPLRDFDLRGESGESLPLLTKDQNGLHAFTSLVAYADALAGPSLPAGLVDDLRAIATGTVAEALATVAKFDSLATDLHAELMQDRVFDQLVNTYARNFILLVDVGANKPSRRIIKFSYIESLMWPPRGFGRLLSNLAWIPTRFEFEVASMGEARSYHFEFTAPRSLGIVRSQLVEVRNNTDEDTLYEDPEPLSETHLYSSQRADGAISARVWLEPFRSGLIRMSASVVCLNALILVLAFLRLDEVAKVATAGLLVAIPGLIAASVSRPGEHAVATELLFGVRALVGLSGLVAFLAGLSLAGGFDPDALRLLWIPLVVVACGAVPVIAASYFEVSWIREKYRGA